MLRGIFAPIPTPFKAGSVTYTEFRRNLERWAKTRLTGLVVLGSNGEFVYLTPDEKIDVIRFVRENFPAGRTVIAGTGAESTGGTIELTRRAADAGADAALVLTPHYYRGGMTDEVLARFFTEVADASPIPVVLYNMPRNTGLNMSPALICRLAEHPNIVGIKDSGGNIVQISEVVKGTPDEFSVFAGSGSFLLTSLVMGAVGGTLAVANVLPHLCTVLYDEFNNGNLEHAVQLQRQLLKVNSAVTSGYGIPGLKAALDMLGYYGGEPRRPLLPLAEDKRRHLRQLLEEAGAFEES